MRPPFIDQYIQADRLEKDAKEIKSKLRAQVESYLRENEDPDIKQSITKKEVLKEDVILPWAYQNLKPEDYEDLFVKVFDPNKFAEKMRRGIIQEQKLPSTYREVSEQTRITVGKEKPIEFPVATASARRKSAGAKKA